MARSCAVDHDGLGICTVLETLYSPGCWYCTVLTLAGSSVLVRLLGLYCINACWQFGTGPTVDFVLYRRLLVVLYWPGCWYCTVSTLVGSLVLVRLLILYHIVVHNIKVTLTSFNFLYVLHFNKERSNFPDKNLPLLDLKLEKIYI